MNKKLLYFVSISLLFIACKEEQDPFQIGQQHVGLLTDSTQVKDLDAIFSNDSVAKHVSADTFTGSYNDIEIFEKGGNKLLILTPEQPLDSTAVIKDIRIIDKRYKSDKNVSVASTFKDIRENYEISGIDNLINSILVSVKELNATFTIDKKELPANLRFDMSLNIEASQIPDEAAIKYLFINWN